MKLKLCITISITDIHIYLSKFVLLNVWKEASHDRCKMEVSQQESDLFLCLAFPTKTSAVQQNFSICFNHLPLIRSKRNCFLNFLQKESCRKILMKFLYLFCFMKWPKRICWQSFFQCIIIFPAVFNCLSFLWFN